jgi:hypothetical protein
MRRAERGRSRAVVAPEGLGELGRLAVAHAVRDLADGEPAARQQLARALHAHGREVLPERGVPDLGIGALQLPARRCDTTRDVVQGQLGAELGFDDRGRVLEERGAMSDGCGSLDWHLVQVRLLCVQQMTSCACGSPVGAGALAQMHAIWRSTFLPNDLNG